MPHGGHRVGTSAPMEALGVLYGEGQEVASRAIVDGIIEQIFDSPQRQPLAGIRRKLTGFAFWSMDKTTRKEVRTGPGGSQSIIYHNRILERSGHPYIATLLRPGDATASLVEGGDPMNAIYMMLCPEVERRAKLWDRLLLDSVPSRDVQVRFLWETRLTHELATRRLRNGKPVRIKAFAAGTGLSVVLVCERLLREGHDPKLLRAVISDRDPAHRHKTLRLIRKLPLLCDQIDESGEATHGILARAEDIFHPTLTGSPELPFDIVTAVGILEYFSGHTYKTTEARLGEGTPAEKPDAADLLRVIANQTAEGGNLIVNTHREAAATRILEVFGKRFRYRKLENLRALAATANFEPTGTSFSGNVYDIEVFAKSARAL